MSPTTWPAPRPTYLGVGRDPVFGLFHDAEPGGRRGPGVLIVPPFGWEEVCSYRSRREWAATLAGRGHPALRLDLPGTGDSGGTSEDADLVTAWIAAVRDAADWLSAETEGGEVAAIGIGLGGLIAYRAAADGGPLGDLVLWGTPARGRALVRELKAFALLNDEDAGRGDERPAAAPGGIETGGFLMTPGTQEGVAGIDLTKLDLAVTGGRRVMLLGRDGIEADARLLAHLEGSGASVEVGAGPGYGRMMAHPQEATSPLGVFATVGEWLDRGTISGGSSPAMSVEVRPTTEVGSGEARIRETPIQIESSFGRLFGVLAEPLSGPTAQTCAVLLNAGALRRIGPGRMWVELARRWATRGVPTLRLDIEGIGDADGDGSRYADDRELYVPELVEQVLATLDELGRRGMPRRILLCGLCSGAYWSFHATLRDERVATAFLVNPRALYWDDVLLAEREVRKSGKLLAGASWGRILRGKVPPRRFLEVARSTVTYLVRLPGRLLGRRARRRQLDDALDRLRVGGKRVLFVFGDREPLCDELERDGRLDQPERWPNLELVRVSGHHHALEPILAQRRVHEVLDRALEVELAASSDSGAPTRSPIGSPH